MEEVLDAGPDRPRRPRPRWLVVGLVLGAVLLAGGLAVASILDGRQPTPRPAAGVEPSASRQPAASTTCPTDTMPSSGMPRPKRALEVSALVIGTSGQATTLTRLDTTARQGPWTVVVRRADGSLGRHGAVVTFPVPADSSRPANMAGAVARGEGSVVWALGGTFARVRGDVGGAALLAIAEGTTLVDRRPVVRPPDGFEVVASAPYRPRVVHEVRYTDNRVLGAAGATLGFVYTGVLRGGGFEDQLYAGQPRSAGVVHGHPAVLSTVMGGNATLAWSPEPGVVAYVGYSGRSLDDAAVAALGCLARQTRPLTEAQWRAAAPFVEAQTNDFG